MKKVAIVTVNYNTEVDTNNFLKSLKKLNTEDFTYQVIIIDNGSTKVFLLSDKEKDKRITIIRLEKNTGFAGGYNTGIKKAMQDGADFILVVNNDTIVQPDLIKNLLPVLESDNKIGVVAPKIYFAKGHEFHKDKYKPEELGKVLWFAGGYTDWDHAKSVHRGVDEVDHGQYNKTEKIDFASGCCLLVKREVFEKVGLFDEQYFLYYEDADLNERIKKVGYHIYYVPTAAIEHVNASSTGGAGSIIQDYYITRNRMLFGMKYAPLRTKAALMRESGNLLLGGRLYQKKAIRDYYLGKFGEGKYFK